MARGSHHLSAEERDHVAVLRSRGLSVRAIARALGRSPATLSRERRRAMRHPSTPAIPCPTRPRLGRRQRRGYSRRHTRPHIPERVPIIERPAAATRRQQLGHGDAATMTTRQGRAVLQLVVDRKSRYLLLNRFTQRTAAAMRVGLLRSLAQLPRQVRPTITSDNGTENVEHARVNAVLGIRSYFCTPYASQERGTVANMAGLGRRFFPKGTNFPTLLHQDVKAVQRWLNHRPRRALHVQTPVKVFRSGVALRT